MITFFTNSTQHFAQKITLSQAAYYCKKFSDGELYVKIDPEIKDQEVWIVASTQPPAENLLELFFLLDALVRTGIQKINLFFTYFAYARQAVALPGEAASAQLVCSILKKFHLKKIYIFHVHAAHILHTYLHFNNVINIDFFCSVAKNYDIIAAPDKGAFDFAQAVANSCKKEIVFFHKKRFGHEKVIVESVNGNVAGKKVLLVDDIISTGYTLIQASQAIKNLNAREVSAAATHAVFSPGAYERLQESPLEKIYVTNTLGPISKGKIEVSDMSVFIESVIISK